MALSFQTVRINFPSTTGRAQIETRTATFPRPVRTAQIALNGFDIDYRNGDHHLLRARVELSSPTADSLRAVTVAGNTVTFQAGLLLRDSSGAIDDPYGGFVDVLVIADLN